MSQDEFESPSFQTELTPELAASSSEMHPMEETVTSAESVEHEQTEASEATASSESAVHQKSFFARLKDRTETLLKSDSVQKLRSRVTQRIDSIAPGLRERAAGFSKNIQGSNLTPKKIRIALGSLAAIPLLVVCYQLIFSRKQSVDASMLVPEIRSFTIVQTKLVHEIQNPGTVTYYEKAAVSSKILGRVEKIFVEQGSKVTKGQKLAQMETFELNLKQRQTQGAMLQALAQLNLQRARYSAARRDVEKQITSIERSGSDIIESKAQYINARQNLENKKELYDLGGVSGVELKQTYAQYLGAVSRLFQTRKDYFTRLIGFRDSDLTQSNIQIPADGTQKKQAFVDFNTQVDFHSVKASEASYQNAQIELDNINLMMKESTISSPLAGVVAARSIEIGEEVKQSEPLFTIVRMDKLVVETQLPEEEVKHIAQGSKVNFTADARDNQKFQGDVYLISPIIDVKTRSAQIRVLFENKDNALAPGMFVRTSITTRVKEQGIAIPESAITNRRKDENSNDVADVFVLEKGLSIKRTVVIGNRYGDKFEITAGLKPGEIIATDSVDILKDGGKVRLKQPPAVDQGMKK